MRKFYKIGNGGLQVSSLATKESSSNMVRMLNSLDSDEYFMTDKELATKYKLKVAMVKKIRESSSIPIKEDRIVRILRTIDTKSMYVDRIVLLLKDKITYNSLYVLMCKNEIPFMRKNRI
jgi:hypothetical protein